MRKTAILQARAQVHNAFHKARADRAAFSLLIRREWERHGYVRVEPFEGGFTLVIHTAGNPTMWFPTFPALLAYLQE